MASTAQAEEAPESLKSVLLELHQWDQDPVLIAAIEEQNAKNVSIEQIKQRDHQWMATSDVDDFMNQLMNNEAAQHLFELESSQPYFLEMFLTANQGENVAMTNKTSDYWQGDEAKFTQAQTPGQLYVSDVEYDDSTMTYLVQVSIPMLKNDQVIGVLVVGINLDELP
ncbi:hypothetical protein BFW38_05655 [Terasakiispira papahanaumokuakeensis]|uniref:Cache domain-containing protein n=2 Tax=Terasakiispira papahanaumokuakeensis TaxID=197479 RepID=A0A1E2VE10_9GAMM|nr:hypothetical protein BFW38_05655 [Terasakiispira papahanaumokuakeensis]